MEYKSKRTMAILGTLTLALVLSGCSSNRFANRDAKAVQVNTNLEILPKTPEKAQIQDQCTRSFTLLQKLDSEKFTTYRFQFDEINDAFFFFKRNNNLMNRDSKELMTSVLDAKLDVVCVRVENASFIGVYGKMKKIMNM